MALKLSALRIGRTLFRRKSQSYSHTCTKFGSNRAPRRYILNNIFYAPWRYITHSSADLHTVTSSHWRLPSNSNNLISSTMWIIQIPCLSHQPPCEIYIIHTQDLTHTYSNIFLKLVVCILLRVLGQVQGFRLTQHVYISAWRWS
jgi:hypothetical protein